MSLFNTEENGVFAGLMVAPKRDNEKIYCFFPWALGWEDTVGQTGGAGAGDGWRLA